MSGINHEPLTAMQKIGGTLSSIWLSWFGYYHDQPWALILAGVLITIVVIFHFCIDPLMELLEILTNQRDDYRNKLHKLQSDLDQTAPAK